MPSESMSQAGLTFRTEADGTTATIYCSGRLMAGDSDALRSEVKSLFPRVQRIVLDLSHLTRMDSMGLGAIVTLYVSAKAAGRELILVNFGERVRQLLIMTNLLSIFEEYGKHIVKMP